MKTQRTNKKIVGNVASFEAHKVVMMGEGVLADDRLREMKDDAIAVSGGGWVSYMSKTQSFLDGVMALLENSGTLNAIIRDKLTLMLAGGLVVSKGRKGVLRVLRKLWEQLTGQEDELQSLNDFLSDINKDSEEVLDVIERGFNDFLSGGNGFFEMIKGEGVEGTGRFFWLNHWDWTKCQIKAEKRDKDGRIVQGRMVGINDDWQKDTKGDNATVVALYPEWTEMDDGTQRSVIHVKDYLRGFKYWGGAEWFAVDKFVELEYRVGLYNVSKLKNGYKPSAIIQLFGSKNATEAKKVVADITNAFTDSGNNSKLFVQVLSDERYKANIQVLEDKSDGNYLELTKLAVQRIVTGTRWAMSMAGVETAGKLGNNQQPRAEYEKVNNMVINPLRKKAIKVIDIVVDNAAEWLEEKAWDEMVFAFGNNSVFSLIDKIDVNAVLSLNERRVMIGAEALDDDGKKEFFNEKQNINANNTNDFAGQGD